MKRLKALLAMIIVLTAAAASMQVAPAHAAYPTTDFDVAGGAGYANGGIIWLNRSVEIQGEVVDANSSGYTQVRFTFFLENAVTPYSTTTRTATDDASSSKVRVSYHFTQPGPVGGIWRVDVRVCSAPGGCDPEEGHIRP
jgi:hypothetical protein